MVMAVLALVLGVSGDEYRYGRATNYWDNNQVRGHQQSRPRIGFPAATATAVVEFDCCCCVEPWGWQRCLGKA